MKRFATVLFTVLASLAATAGAQNDINIITANSDVFISEGGRLVLSSPTTNRGMNRWAHLNLAVEKSNVYNFDDSSTVLGPPTVDSTSAARKADYVLRHVISPAMGTAGTSRAGSTLQHVMTVYIWKDLKGVVVAYRLKNTGASSVSGKVSFELYPRIDQSYTDHKLRWSAAENIAYFFRGTLAHYMGGKFLSGTPTSARLSAGTAFYVSGSFAETQPDSVRFNAANYTGFDASVDSPAGTRAMIHLNASQITIAPNDSSAAYYYALAYDVSEAGMIQAIKGAETRYRERFPVSVAERDGEVPAGFALHQNYPNPFNPSTDIRLQLPQRDHVSLKIYDAAGREVQTLVNRTMNAGSHAFTFDATRLPSGVYFYTVRTNNFTATRKMLLMK